MGEVEKRTRLKEEDKNGSEKKSGDGETASKRGEKWGR